MGYDKHEERRRIPRFPLRGVSFIAAILTVIVVAALLLSVDRVNVGYVAVIVDAYMHGSPGLEEKFRQVTNALQTPELTTELGNDEEKASYCQVLTVFKTGRANRYLEMFFCSSICFFVCSFVRSFVRLHACDSRVLGPVYTLNP